MNLVGFLIVVLALPAALCLGLVMRIGEEIINYFKSPYDKVLKKSREKEIGFQFLEPEINPKTGKKKKKHRDRRDYKKSS